MLTMVRTEVIPMDAMRRPVAQVGLKPSRSTSTASNAPLGVNVLQFKLTAP
jgi:hypothetical protein